MPAPRPITIDYTPASSLLQASIAAGQMQGDRQRNAIQREQQQRQPQRPSFAAAANRRQGISAADSAMRLQRAGAQTFRNPALNAPMSGADKEIRNPLGGSIRGRMSQGTGSMTGDGHTYDINDASSMPAGADRGGGFSQFEDTQVGENGYLDTIMQRPGLPDQTMRELETLRTSGLTPNQMRTAADSIIRNTAGAKDAFSPKDKVKFEMSNLDSQISDLRRQEQALLKEMGESDQDPDASSAGLTPDARPTGGSINEFWRGAADTVLPGQPFSSVSRGGDSDKLKRAVKLAQLRRQQQLLVEQQRGMMQGGSGPQDVQPLDNVDVSTLSNDDLFKALMGN